MFTRGNMFQLQLYLISKNKNDLWCPWQRCKQICMKRVNVEIRENIKATNNMRKKLYYTRRCIIRIKSLENIRGQYFILNRRMNMLYNIDFVLEHLS